MDISSRIKQLRDQKKLNQASFAQVLGTSQAAISRYEKGERMPGSEFLSKLSNVYGVNISWILTGEGDIYDNDRAREGPFTKFLRLPVVGDIAAGLPIEVIPEEPSEYIEVSTTLLTLPPPYFVFRVDGESMLPVIYPGDYVVISTDWRGIKSLHQRICAFRTADGITLKQYVDDRKHKTIWLFPINSSFTPIPFNKSTEDFHLIGVLILSIRKYT